MKENSTGRRILARVVPGITRHTVSLAGWLENDFPPPCAACGLWAVAANVADRREAARLLGKHDIEDRSARLAVHLVEFLLERSGDPQWVELERALAAKD
jgi:hypothetical protein